MDPEREKVFSGIGRLLCEIRPRFVFLENVPVTTINGVEKVHNEYFDIGYLCRWGMANSGSRERWFLLGYEVQTRLFKYERHEQEATFESYVRLDDLPFPEEENHRLDNQVHAIQTRHAFKLLMGME